MLVQGLGLFLVATALIVAGGTIPSLAATGIVVPAVLLWLPTILVVSGKIPVERLSIQNVKKWDALKGLGVCIPATLFYGIFLFLMSPKAIILPHISLTVAPLIVYSLIIETAAVSIPEELFFRGYLQSTLELHFERSKIIPIVTSAALFAFLHYANTSNPGRLEVFFPGILLGVLRYHTGNIWASVACHSLCNVFHYLITGQLLS